MPEWLDDVVVGFGALAAVLLVRGLQDWRHARTRLRALEVGESLTIDAFLRGSAAPYPRRWRLGWLTVNEGPPTWKPRFSLARRRVILPMNASVDRVRGITSLWESVMVNPGCRVIVARLGDLKVELAVFPPDLSSAQQALQSGSAGPIGRPTP